MEKIMDLDTPAKVQDFLNCMEYNSGKPLSPQQALNEKKGNCIEAAALACYILQQHKFDAFLLDLRSVRDEDHILCVYKFKEKYGSIAQSKFLGLRGRLCVYASIRELVMTYFEHYFNFFGEYSLREFSVPYYPNKLGKNWIKDIKLMDKIADELDEIKHFKIIGRDIKERADYNKFWREILILPKNTRIGKKYQNKLS